MKREMDTEPKVIATGGLAPLMANVSETIEQRHGYRPEERLVALYFDEGPTGKRVRYQYFEVIADLFSDRDYEVSTAGNGEDAMALIQLGAKDVVLKPYTAAALAEIVG